MASRQMAFQLGALEYLEALKLFVALGEKRVDVKAYLSAIADEKRRERLSAALQIATETHAKGKDPLKVRKVICWRNTEGKPGTLEAQLATA